MKPPHLSMDRPPLESREPIAEFALSRVLIAGAAVAGLAILGFPYEGAPTAVLAALVLPWAVAVLVVTRRSPQAGLSVLVPIGDFVVLGVLQAVEPELYAPVHFTALFLVAAHAHFQGADRSLLVGVLPPAILIPVTAATDVPIESGLLNAYECVFAVSCVAAALIVGSLRTAESRGRLRARELSRRTLDQESEVRRRLAEAIHDGPIQELSSVELMLASVEQALEHEDAELARSTLHDARELTRSNITFLRDEVLELGPQGFEELTFRQAIADCVPVWERRYGFTVELEVEAEILPSAVAGPLFRIAQEAVTNAGKHAQASHVTVRLQQDGREVVLEVIDDGGGFGEVDPFGPGEPGHIGLATMRERAEMLEGLLQVESGDGGTRVCARIPI